jgi:hypothetical protein
MTMPTRAELEARHGTPEAFERAVWKAHADLFITTGEAEAAIAKYRTEWKVAEVSEYLLGQLKPYVGEPLSRDRILEIAEETCKALNQLGTIKFDVVADKCAGDSIVMNVTIPAWMIIEEAPDGPRPVP